MSRSYVEQRSLYQHEIGHINLMGHTGTLDGFQPYSRTVMGPTGGSSCGPFPRGPYLVGEDIAAEEYNWWTNGGQQRDVCIRYAGIGPGKLVHN